MIGEMTQARDRGTTGRDGFAQALRSEWTKFWTVRGWTVSLVLAAVLTVGIPLVLANGGASNGSLPDREARP